MVIPVSSLDILVPDATDPALKISPLVTPFSLSKIPVLTLLFKSELSIWTKEPVALSFGTDWYPVCIATSLNVTVFLSSEIISGDEVAGETKMFLL